MAVDRTFQPSYGSGAVVTPAAGSANVTIPAGKSLCLTNLGTNVCYIRVGQTSQTATTADYPVPPGMQVIVTKDDRDVNMAHISAAGTTLHYMVGEGF